MSKYALSTQTQGKVVARYIIKHGSINRYEADKIGVCGLAPRIKELKEKGFEILSHREIATDLHGLKHNGISRYWVDLKNMDKEEREKLFKFIGDAANGSNFENEKPKKLI
jgi:hypothetical protein